MGEKRRVAPKETIVAQGLHPHPGPTTYHALDDSEGSAWEQESQQSANLSYEHDEEAHEWINDGEAEQVEQATVDDTVPLWHRQYLQQHQAFWPLDDQYRHQVQSSRHGRVGACPPCPVSEPRW